MSADVTPIEGWVELELLGHRRLYGYVSSIEVEPGVFMLQFHVPAVEDQPEQTHFYSYQAVYGIHPTTEAAVIEKLTPWKPPAECGATFRGPVLGDQDDTCTRVAGHPGEHEGLPF